MSAAVLPQQPAAAWRELWLISIGHGLTHWYPATFYLLLPLIGNEFGLSYSQIGLIMTCQYVASAIGLLASGCYAEAATHVAQARAVASVLTRQASAADLKRGLNAVAGESGQ